MHDAIRSMLSRYTLETRDDYVNALREIIQETALLGLWRVKFFQQAAFYGGTALRILHGLDRYSEDLDFSLLVPDPGFSLAPYGESLRREINGFGLNVEFDRKKKAVETRIESAFLKSDTYRELIVVESPPALLRTVHQGTHLKIKIEVDTDPPEGFVTENRYVLQPIPFSVRTFSLPDLFAGKLHAILFRRWKTRVKGRDWYDLVWYVSRHPQVRLSHLESRMRQTGDYNADHPLIIETLHGLLRDAVDSLDVEQARNEVAPFVRDQRSLEVWSREFFHTLIPRISEA